MQNKSRRIIMNTRICLEKCDKIGGVTEIEKIIKQTQPELFKIANDAGRKRKK